MDSHLVAREVKATAEELFTLVAWAANSSRGRGGTAPLERAFGMVPRDPLTVQVWDELTTAQSLPESQHLERVRTKSVALHSFGEEVVKAKIARIQEGHARAGDKDEVSGEEKFVPGDQVEIHRGSGHKDVSSWKGPGTVVSIGDPVTGNLEAGVRARYQGS